MFDTELTSSSGIPKLRPLDHNIDSALHAVCRSDHLRGMYHQSDIGESGPLESCIPCTVSDVHQFSRMAYAIRNTYFNLPNAMMYSKFRYILSELTKTTQLHQFMYLDPMLSVSPDERLIGLRSLSEDWTEWASNLSVCRIINTATSILSLPIELETRTTVTNTLMSVGSGSRVHLTFKEFEVHSVAHQRDRQYLLRLLASEDTTISPRSLLLLIDNSIPLEVIPGFTQVSSVLSSAMAVSK